MSVLSSIVTSSAFGRASILDLTTSAVASDTLIYFFVEDAPDSIFVHVLLSALSSTVGPVIVPVTAMPVLPELPGTLPFPPVPPLPPVTVAEPLLTVMLPATPLPPFPPLLPLIS